MQVYFLVAGIRRYMTQKAKEKNPSANIVNNIILDETNPNFSGLRGTRKRIACELQAAGIGA